MINVNSISETDIDLYFWNKDNQRKSNNSKNNEWRENCIAEMLNIYLSGNEISLVNRPKFKQLYQSLISVFNNENFVKDHGKIKKIIVKGGRKLNYDIELVSEKNYSIKIEFKFHAGKESVENLHQVHKVIPQCLQVYLNNDRSILEIGDEEYINNYYKSYIPNIKTYYNLQRPICSLESYKKNITETLTKNDNGIYHFSQNIDNNFKLFMEEFYNATKNEIKQYKNSNDKNTRDNFPNKCFYKSRHNFLEKYGQNINYQTIESLLKEKVNTRDYYLVYNCNAKKFTLIRNSEIIIKNHSSLISSNKQYKSIMVNAELDNKPVNLECLLRWKNTNGCIGPAWQIGIKYPKKKFKKRIKINHPSQAINMLDLYNMKLSDMKAFINSSDQTILRSLKGRKTKQILVPILWGLKTINNI